MRRLIALLLAASASASETPSPVVAELLRHVPPEQVQPLGASPTLRAAAAAVPDPRRDAAGATLKRLESGAPPRILIELTHAYLYLAQPAEAERVSRLAQAAMPGVEGFAFRAWAAQQAGDNEAAEEAAREGLKLAPRRPDLVAILKLTEGRTRERQGSPSLPAPSPSALPSPRVDSPILAENARRREAERLLAEAVRAKDLGDVVRARILVRRARESDPNSPELQRLIATLDDAAQPGHTEDALSLLLETETGGEIAAFLKKEKIPIRQANKLPGSAAAYYDFRQRTIFLGPDFASEPPVSQAMLLGHEGYHAIQDLRYSMAPVLESEQDAWLRTMAIYDELRALGQPALPASHPWIRYEVEFRRAVSQGDPDTFYRHIQRSYEHDAETRQELELNAIPRAARRPMRILFKTVYFPAYMNSVPARNLQLSVSGYLVNGWQKLFNTVRRHEEEQKWFAQWLKRSSP